MRPLSFAALSAALTLGIALSARAQTSSARLTAEEAVREALAANRDLQAARLAIDVARGGLLQVGRLENPELQAAFADDFAFRAEGERVGSVGFAQRFPVTARLARERDVAGKDVEVAEAEVRNFIRTLVADVQGGFYSVLALDRRLAVHRQLIAWVREVENATARRAEVAEASPAEVSLLRVERLRLEQEGQRLTREREVEAGALARLRGQHIPDGRIPIGDLDPGPLPPGALAGGPAVWAARPDLDAATRGVERADADRALARSQVWQDWTVGLGYEQDRGVFDDPIGVKRDTFLTFALTVPLPLWNRQQGRIAAAEAERRRARRAREALELRIEEQIRAAAVRVRTLRSSVDVYAREILPEATHSRDLFERGYREGLVGISELLQAQRQYNESRSRHLELLADLRQAAIALEAARGSSPHLSSLGNPGGTP